MLIVGFYIEFLFQSFCEAYFDGSTMSFALFTTTDIYELDLGLSPDMPKFGAYFILYLWSTEGAL